MSDKVKAAKILIAEDETIVAEDLALTLQDLGYHVVGTVSTGFSAIQLAEEEKPDLILMDIKLGGDIDGIQASERIRARLDIPVIFLTAYEETDTIARAKVTEPYGFLAKPFSFFVLNTTIEMALYKHAADKLVRESEERYRMLVEQSIDGIALIQGTTLRFGNSGLAKMFGFQNKDEVEGQDILPFVAPEYRDLMEKMGVEREDGKPVLDRYEFTALRKDGTPFTAEIRVSLTTYHGEKARQGVIRDISDRKKAEEALRESEERFRTLMAHSPTAIAVNGPMGEIEYLNNKFIKIFGYTLKDIPTIEHWWRLAYPDPQYGERVKSEWLRATRESADKISEAQPVEREIRCKDGTIRFIEVRKTATDKSVIHTFDDITDRKKAEEALREAHDQLEERVKASTSELRETNEQLKREIAERKEAEDALRSSEEKYRLLVDKAPIGIVSVDTEGRVLEVNQRLVDMLGSPSADATKAINVLSFELLVAAGVSDVFKSCLEQGTAQSAEMPYTSKWGKKVYLRTLVSPVFDENGGVTGCQGVMEDISERKNAEEALRKSEERLELALKGADLAMWDYNIQTGEAAFNARRAEMVGYTLEEAEPRISWWGKQVHPEDMDRVIEAFIAHAEGHLPLYECEHRIRHKSGEYIWILARGKIVERDERGYPVRMVGTSLDITDRKRAEEALLSARNQLQRRVEERTAELKSSEEKYKVLVEESFDGVFVQKGTKIVFTNSRFREMLGYAEGELEGRDHWSVFHPEYQELTRERAKARLQGQPELSRYEVRMQRKDGSSFEAEINARMVKFVGEPGIQAWIRDISERKLAENALRESEERFRIAFQTSPDPIAITRLSDGVFIEVNKGFTELTGFTREAVIGKSSRDISIWYDPGDRDRLIAELKKRGHVMNLEARFRQRDGEVRAGLMSASIIVLGGEPHLLTLTRDVEDWKKAEQALRDSEEKYRALFEQSMDAVYMTTREGILVDANQAFLDLFGLSGEEARNMDIFKIYPDPSERRRFQQEIERKGSLKDYEISFRKNDGTKIEGLLTSTVRRDKDGAVIGYQGIVRDVTGLKQIQRQLLQAQKLEAVGTLAGGIAHDFNNLLQAILGYTDLLLMRTKKTDPMHKKLEIVRQAARDGGDLVSRLLTVSMKAEFNARPTDLNEEILRVEKLLRRTIPRMIAIDLVLADDLWIIDSHSTQVEQVLLNLAVNAHHAMPDGGRLLIETSNVSLGSDYMRSHLEVEPGNYVLLTVSDTGTGMEPEVVDRIFEPFFTTKASGEGTGLGLAMVHGIVSQHGGYIRCYSEPGLGTSFKIYFPISQTERLLDMAETREMLAFGTETILLVDDDKRIRDVARLMIEMGGYKVIAASSGEEALEMYAHHKSEIPLVILDLIMPGMGGKKCLEELLRIDPDARVLFASGYSSNGLTVGETGTGARGFIRKPYDAKDILAAIRKVLDKGYV